MYPRLTGRVVLDYLAQLRGGVDQRVRDSLVERFDADLDRPIRELSTGNRQKLGLIQAFMHEPELLILDEPVAGLDPLVQQSFHALLGEVSAQGRTVFLSSHTLSEVERVTHRLAILRQGRLVVVDSLENLRNVAVQRLEIEFSAPVDAGEFRSLPGLTEVHADGVTLIVGFEGSADAVVKAAATHVRCLRPETKSTERLSKGSPRRSRCGRESSGSASPAAISTSAPRRGVGAIWHRYRGPRLCDDLAIETELSTSAIASDLRTLRRGQPDAWPRSRTASAAASRVGSASRRTRRRGPGCQ
jgi:ABC transporter